MRSSHDVRIVKAEVTNETEVTTANNNRSMTQVDDILILKLSCRSLLGMLLQ